MQANIVSDRVAYSCVEKLVPNSAQRRNLTSISSCVPRTNCNFVSQLAALVPDCGLCGLACPEDFVADNGSAFHKACHENVTTEMVPEASATSKDPEGKVFA